MNVSIVIATCGAPEWEELAWSRAFPSADRQGALEVLVHHDPHGTVAGVRNVVAATARGDWLCFLDADDELAPGYLREMRFAAACGALTAPALGIPAVTYVDAEGRETAPCVPNVDHPFRVMNHAVIGTLVPRVIFEAIGGFDTTLEMYEDWHAWRRCELAGAQLVYVPRAVYRAHQSAEGRNEGSAARKARAYTTIVRDLKRLEREAV